MRLLSDGRFKSVRVLVCRCRRVVCVCVYLAIPPIGLRNRGTLSRANNDSVKLFNRNFGSFGDAKSGV